MLRLHLKVSEDALEETGKCYSQKSISETSIWSWYTEQAGGGRKKTKLMDTLEDFGDMLDIHGA